MSRMDKPGWKPCEEFRKKEVVAEEYGENSEAPEEEGGGEPVPVSPRFKNLAQANRREVPMVKKNLKAMLPMLTPVDIRRYRIPHWEAVIYELEEAGLVDAAQYMRMLLALDEEMRIKAGPGTIVWKKPRLKFEKKYIDRLRGGLTRANEAKEAELLITQAAALLETALYFQKQTWEWWWIAEQLFRSALTVSEAIEDDDYQAITMIRYLYGRFLFNEMKDAQEALDYLNDARESAQGKPWNASRILGLKQESLFRECCTLLYRALLTLARQVRDEDPELAVRACINALKRATDAAHDDYIAESLCELGKSYLCAGETKQALHSFSKFLALTTRIPDPEGICDAHMELAFAYKEIEDEENTMRHLQEFRECASEFQLPYKLAQAHYHTGEHLLNRSHPSLATPHLGFAFALYNSLGQTVEANQARSVAAVSMGQEVIDQLIDLILKSGKYDQEATQKICFWKNSRVPFWRFEQAEEIGEREEFIGESEISASPSNLFVTSPLDRDGEPVFDPQGPEPIEADHGGEDQTIKITDPD